MGKWIPKSPEEAKKRHAGRRKPHIRKRAVRAERIREVLSNMLGGDAAGAEMLRKGEYGATRSAAEGFGVSEPTMSRDLSLCRRMLKQFQVLYGRDFNPATDEIIWAWDYAKYGFRVDGLENPARFPFTTRDT